jgi:ATP-dependent helicase/nuclease subunit B
MKFIDEIAEYIKNNDLKLNKLTIVIPSQRAKKYISSALFKVYGKPLFSPDIITIDSWIRRNCPKTIIDKTRLLLMLYEIHINSSYTSEDEVFEDFMNWGPILLNDIDEIDRYEVPSKQVFQNLANIKDIENWSFNSEELSLGQHKFLEFWDRLADYYTLLQIKLEQNNCTYLGNAYRIIAENIDLILKEDSEHQFIFAGFNALSKSELKIMRLLQQMGKAHILIDADLYYLEDNNHEAGVFLNTLKRTLQIKDIPFTKDVLKSKTLNVKVIECAQKTGQVKVMGSKLQDASQHTIENTLVLLADESLIVPVLQNIPENVKKANITLGLPLLHTAIKTWIELIFSIQESKNRWKTSGIYIYDLQRFWSHPFVLASMDHKQRRHIASLEEKFIAKNTLFIGLSKLEIGKTHDALLQAITTNWESNWQLAMHQIRKMNALVHNELQNGYPFEKALIQSFDSGIQDFNNIINEGLPAMTLKSFKHIFQQHWGNISIAYHGNPIEGLQIMGLLETRLLDFENIIILGFNEGNLPPINPIQTLIPMDLRAYFELPTPRQKQGLFAHHFYRLLHYCKNLTITYCSSSESMGSNEASRYLQQLELELQRNNSNVKISKEFYFIPNNKSVINNSNKIDKSPELKHRLDEFFTKPISASAVNKYLNCPLDFYYRHVLDFGEEDSIEEEVENSQLGTFIHHTLEKLYEPFARHDKNGQLKDNQPKNILPNDVKGMLTKYSSYLRAEFIEHFDGDESAFSTGKNLLSYNMAHELMERLLKKEIEYLSKQSLPVHIEYLEVKLTADLEIERNGKMKKIPVKGYIDRIDSIGDQFRIVDYKTGKINKEDVNFKKGLDQEDLITGFKSVKHVVQLAFYCYLFQKNFNFIPSEAAIISLINSSESPIKMESDVITLKELTAIFPKFMEQVITDIYDESKPFQHKQTYDVSYCKYCD